MLFIIKFKDFKYYKKVLQTFTFINCYILQSDIPIGGFIIKSVVAIAFNKVVYSL